MHGEGGSGMDIRGDALTPSLARGRLIVGPLRGRGPRPFVPFLGPLLGATLFGTPARA